MVKVKQSFNISENQTKNCLVINKKKKPEKEEKQEW